MPDTLDPRILEMMHNAKPPKAYYKGVEVKITDTWVDAWGIGCCCIELANGAKLNVSQSEVTWGE